MDQEEVTLQDIENNDFKIDPEYAVALDGGTVGFSLTLGSKKHDMYLDRRLNSSTRDEFYIGDYPGNEGSTYLGKSDKLKSALDEIVKKDQREYK
jgi:hypothetical protein